jgi:hypothetical protein
VRERKVYSVKLMELEWDHTFWEIREGVGEVELVCTWSLRRTEKRWT